MKKILIDLDLYTENKDKDFGCSYFYHSENKGVRSLLELATYAIICRKCELAPCVTACPTGARRWGNVADPDDTVIAYIRTNHVYTLRSETGNDPQVRYTQLAREVL